MLQVIHLISSSLANSVACAVILDVCNNSLSCQRGGYVDPNNCARCRCPDGFAGTSCQSIAPQNSGNVHVCTLM